MIGKATVAGLQARGDVVTALQRQPSGLSLKEILGSVSHRDAVAAACQGQHAVVHLAARVGVVGEWDDFYETNVTGTAQVIEESQRAGVGRFVHVSSPSVAHSGDPLVGAGADAANPDAAEGHYARSKAMAEQLALEATSDAMPVIAIRPHLVWGPGDTQLVGRIVTRAKQGRLALVGSGAALIDSTYVDNAADALVAAVDQFSRLGGQALVVSNGEPRTVHELVQQILVAAGVQWTPRHVPTRVAIAGGSMAEGVWARTGRTDDPPMTSFLAEQLSTAHWFDQRTTQELLRWAPRVTLAQGFTALRAWYRDGEPG